MLVETAPPEHLPEIRQRQDAPVNARLEARGNARLEHADKFLGEEVAVEPLVADRQMRRRRNDVQPEEVVHVAAERFRALADAGDMFRNDVAQRGEDAPAAVEIVDVGKGQDLADIREAQDNAYFVEGELFEDLDERGMGVISERGVHRRGDEERKLTLQPGIPHRLDRRDRNVEPRARHPVGRNGADCQDLLDRADGIFLDARPVPGDGGEPGELVGDEGLVGVGIEGRHGRLCGAFLGGRARSAPGPAGAAPCIPGRIRTLDRITHLGFAVHSRKRRPRTRVTLLNLR